MQISTTADSFAIADQERDLVERAKADRIAFAELYRLHYRIVVQYIFRRLGDKHTAEDLAANVFLAALQNITKYQNRGIPIRLWFYRIATNEIHRWLRKHKKMFFLDMGAGTLTRLETRESSLDASSDADSARRALLSLPTKFQTVLSLHYLEEMKLEEVCKITGFRLGTVKSRLARGREALRTKLQKRRIDK